jgi:hypothetical protein
MYRPPHLDEGGHSVLDDDQPEELIFPLHVKNAHQNPSRLQVINAVFMVVMTLAIIGPPILDEVFNLEIGVSEYNHSDAGIHRGDLLIIRSIKINQIAPGDLVIIHGIVGESPDQQHMGIVISTANPNLVNVSIIEDSNQIGATESVEGNSKIHVVTRYFPKIGGVLEFLLKNIVKFGFVFFVGIANLITYVLRRRGARSLESSKQSTRSDALESAPYEIMPEIV